MTYQHNPDCNLDSGHKSPCFGGEYSTLRFGAVEVHLPNQETSSAWLYRPATPNHADLLDREALEVCHQEAVSFAQECGLWPAYPCQLDYPDGSALVPLQRAASEREALGLDCLDKWR